MSLDESHLKQQQRKDNLIRCPAYPADDLLDMVDVLLLLSLRIGVIESAPKIAQNVKYAKNVT